MYCPKCGDPIEANEKFCNKCGFNLDNNNQTQMTNTLNNGVQNNVSQINNLNQYGSPNIVSTNTNNQTQITSNLNNVYQQPINNNKANKKKSLLIGLGIGGASLIILILVFSVVSRKNNYYFSEDVYGKNDEIVEQKNISNEQNNPKRKGKYSTIIIADNTYSGVSIENSNDAYDLISKDSTIQKKNCPSEIKTIEEEIIKKYGITAVNLCEMDVGFANELVKVLERVYTEYPESKSYLTNISLINVSMTDGYIAAFTPAFNFATSNSSNGYPMVEKTQILLNTSYFLNKERLQASVTDGSSSGHFPPNATIYSPVAHEFGHYLSFLATLKQYQVESVLLVDNDNVNAFYQAYSDYGKGKFSLEMIQEAYEECKKETNISLSLDEWRGTISQYALAKDNSGNYIYDETIAESFHDVYLNGENAKDASKYVVKVLKSKLKG